MSGAERPQTKLAEGSAPPGAVPSPYGAFRLKPHRGWIWGGVPCALRMRKVGHSPPPVGSFLGVGLPQGTIAIVYPCSINPPPSCVYVPFAAA